jgi:hypothetical protein
MELLWVLLIALLVVALLSAFGPRMGWGGRDTVEGGGPRSGFAFGPGVLGLVVVVLLVVLLVSLLT